MNKQINNLDEMQEQKLLNIEHHGAWFAFWGLLIAILAQLVFGGDTSFRTIAGEWIVFMCLAVYMCVACIKNGIWDRKLKPNPKTNVIVSLISAMLCGILLFVSSYLKYEKLAGSLFSALFIFILVFLLTFFVLAICASLYKKRAARLERDGEE